MSAFEHTSENRADSWREWINDFYHYIYCELEDTSKFNELIELYTRALKLSCKERMNEH